MSYKLDDIDHAIIKLLQKDGRMACAEIARQVGYVTERVVRFRIKRMRDEGILVISAVVKPETVGFPVMADVWIELESGRVMMEIADALANYPQVLYVACTTGDHDISIMIAARDNRELHWLVADVIGKLPGIKKATMLVIPKVVKDIYQWELPAESVLGAWKLKNQ